MTSTPPDRNPYAPYAAARSARPVQEVPDRSGRVPSILITGDAEAREALTCPALSKDTAAFFANRPSSRNLHPAVAHTMLATDPPAHTRLRGLVTKAFTSAATERLRPFVENLTASLLDSFAGHDEVDLVSALAVPLPVAVISELLGVPHSDRDRVRAWSASLFAAGDDAVIDAASHELAGYVEELVRDKRRAPGDDLLTQLIAVRDGTDQLSDEELVSLAVLLLVAGHETTTNAIGNAVLALLLNPLTLEQLRSQPEQISDAVPELLRFDSPVAMATFRYATEPVELAGVPVPAGAPVLIALGAANRDQRRYPDPDTLTLDRADGTSLAFGHGIHRCLGAPLARAETEIALRAVLGRFPGIRLAVPDGQLTWRHTRLVRGLAALPVQV